MFYFALTGCERPLGDLRADQPFLGACFGDLGANSKFDNFEAQTVDVVVLNLCRVGWCPDTGIRRCHAPIIASGWARRTAGGTRLALRDNVMFGTGPTWPAISALTSDFVAHG
jgi:hypothetical protein